MANLSFVEKEKLETLFKMNSGYILGFESRSKFQGFVKDSIGIDIEEDKYLHRSGSMANRLRKLWEIESDHLVGRLIEDLLSYASEKTPDINQKSLGQCKKIAERLLHLEYLEFDLESEKELSVLTNSIKDSIRIGTPESGLDRLHTYATKVIRIICQKRGISVGSPQKSLDSLLGEYRNLLLKTKEIESKTTGEILKSAGSVFKDFNNTRNKESLAHDNPLLNKDESLLIIKYVTTTLAFIRIIEKRRTDNFKILAENIRSKIFVSEVVGKRVALKVRGKDFLGLCPFHNEKTPSFIVNDEKGFYHCFGCGAHGDSIAFVMNSEQIDYINSIIKLTDDFNTKFNQT